LHNGTLVADGKPNEVIASAVVQEAYLGASPQNASAQAVAPPHPNLPPQGGRSQQP
jgi:branched-chain amino acid transport system ATP-binding protein